MKAAQRATLPFLFFMALMGLMPGDARAQSQAPADMQAEIQAIAKSIVDSLEPAEKTIAGRVKVVVPNTLPLTHLLAGKSPAGEPLVLINVGSYLRVAQLSYAAALNARAIHDDRYLEGYARYLAYADQFPPGRFHTADSYAAMVGLSAPGRMTPSESAQAVVLAQKLHASILGFIIAHEIGHHVLGHVQQIGVTMEQAYEQEQAADEWASRTLINMAWMPVGAVYMMLMLNEAQARVPMAQSTHPAPWKRTLALSERQLDYIRTHPVQVRSALERNGAALSYESLVRVAAATHSGLLLKKAEYEESLLPDPASLEGKAARGNVTAQIQLGGFLETGDHPGIPLDRKRALYWYERAAFQGVGFSLLDFADASYRAANIYGGASFRDDAKACFHLKRSAGTGYVVGAGLYESFLKSGRCQ